MEDKDLYSGFIRLHILHHAAKERIFGLWLIKELARHGYRISPGTLYPILHGLEKKGYLVSAKVEAGGRIRRVYDLTSAGRQVLQNAKEKVRELFGELIKEDSDARKDG